MTENSLTPAERRALVESVRDLAYRFAWRVAVPKLGRDCVDDAAQEAMARACEAARTFDPAAGCKFCTWAYKPMRWAVQQYVTQERRSQQVGVRPDLDLRASAPPRPEPGEREAAVRRQVSRLPKYMREAVEKRYRLGGEPTRGYSGWALDLAVKRLRKEMGVAS